MRTYHTYTCPICGKPYKSLYKRQSPKFQRFCSHKCYTQSNRKLPLTKICEYCGQSFETRRKEAYFCSLQCFGQSRIQGQPRKCPQCGKSFYRQPSHQDRFCSRECYNQNRVENTIKICETCGKEFHTNTSRNNDRYCSRKCWRNRPRTGVWLTCPNCKKQFYVLKSHKKQRRFCSRHCYISYQGPSSIELILMNELDNQSIHYEYQYSIGHWLIDFAFPDHKLAVEADGIYWHSLPHIQKRDRRKDRYLLRKGWTIFRFTGDDIRASPTACVDQVLAHIKD